MRWVRNLVDDGINLDNRLVDDGKTLAACWVNAKKNCSKLDKGQATGL
jgi:hypothetical protein